MKSILIEGQLRSGVGKKATRELRAKGLVPCSVYGGKENINFTAPAHAFKSLVYTPEFYLAELKLDGREVKTVMQDIQFDVITDEIQHIDFRELQDDKKIVVEIPVRLEGVPAGAKEGGKVHQRIKKIKAKLLPKNLVEHITVQIEHLTLGKSVRVSELKIDGIEFLNPANIPIVSVLIPRAAKEEVPAAATAATTTTATAATPAAGAPAAAPAAPEKGAAKSDEKKK
jgi:large subunit ribosomal protein L25